MENASCIADFCLLCCSCCFVECNFGYSQSRSICMYTCSRLSRAFIITIGNLTKINCGTAQNAKQDNKNLIFRKNTKGKTKSVQYIWIKIPFIAISCHLTKCFMTSCANLRIIIRHYLVIISDFVIIDNSCLNIYLVLFKWIQ